MADETCLVSLRLLFHQVPALSPKKKTLKKDCNPKPSASNPQTPTARSRSFGFATVVSEPSWGIEYKP